MNVLMFYKTNAIVSELVDELYKYISTDTIYVVVDAWRNGLPLWANKALELSHIVPEVTFLSLEQFFDGYIPPMKFDYIVGNPPYQANHDNNCGIAGNTGQLWLQVVNKSLSLLTDDGIISFITPRNMFSGSDGSTKDYLGKQASQPIKSISFDTDDMFSIGTKTCRWEIDNSQRDFITNIDGVEFDMRETNFISDTHNVTSIINKVFNMKGYRKIDFNQKGCIDHRRYIISETKTKHFKYPVDFNSKIKYIEEDSVNHHTHKVIYPRLSTDEPYYTFIIANGDSSSAMLIGSKEEGENLVKLMRSKLYKWIIDHLKVGGRLSMKINNLPLVHFTDDKSLYNIFNLSKEEIKEVEK